MKDSRKRMELEQRLWERFIDILSSRGISPEELADDLKGTKVHIPQVNFDVPLEHKIRAKMGPPPYAVRAKRIEDTIEQLEKELAESWKRLAETYRDDPKRFAEVWRAMVETLELDELNALIKEHNTFYPIEANLQPHPETGQYMLGATPWKPKKKVTPEQLLEKFPPDLEKALAEADKQKE